MKVLMIDWERKIIQEVEAVSVQYGEDEVFYTYAISGSITTTRSVPYKSFLGIRE